VKDVIETRTELQQRERTKSLLLSKESSVEVFGAEICLKLGIGFGSTSWAAASAGAAAT
jgi:hypothetical protein